MKRREWAQMHPVPVPVRQCGQNPHDSPRHGVLCFVLTRFRQTVDQSTHCLRILVCAFEYTMNVEIHFKCVLAL